ncbi:type II toxin-antitoxin system RelE/ParE family toxin [Hoeflea sp.]|uniref:type II toxin-antitoxin system RelE/ParE family toxin n=1 Tax=Hoeflea sp. TaxID=1940281 RepID=UPI003A91BB36
MTRLSYSQLALRDLARIHTWSVQQFGGHQADLYLRQIAASLETAVSTPGLFRDASSVRQGLLSLRTGSHVAYVLPASGAFQVVRILHG